MKKFNLTKSLLACAIVLSVSSCANKIKKESYNSPLSNQASEIKNERPSQGDTQSTPVSPAAMTELDGITFEINSGLIDEMRNSPKLSSESDLKVSIEKMPMPDFIHYTFGKLLGVNYVMNESLLEDRSEVSLKIDDLISQQALFDLITKLLLDKNLVVSYENSVVSIKEQTKGRSQEMIGFGYGNQVEDIPLGGDKIVQMVPLVFADQARIARILPKLLRIQYVYDEDSNSLVFTGNYQDVRRALSITKTLDTPSAKSRFVNMFELTFITADEFIETVTQLLKKDGLSVSTGESGALTFTKLPHINSIVVHASNENVLARLEMWRQKLDVAGDTDESKYFVYHSRFADVEDLGESLSNILALKSGQTNGSARNSSSSRNTNSQARTNSSTNSNNSNSGRTSRSSSSDNNVAVDDKRNTLTFYMTPAEYQSLLPIIEQLDVQAKQVVIEVTLMEVTMTGRLAYGLEWFIKNSTESFGTKDGLGGIGAGLTYTLTRPGLEVLLNLRESENLVNIVSNPKLMVTDGESASISIGTDIPVLSGVIESESGSITQNVGTRTTGVDLNIGVQVTSGNQVNLEIDQQLSEAGENELTSVDSPVVLKRKLQTKVTAKGGQTVMLAGLISQNNSNVDTQVPLFGDIPVLGNLFQTTSKTDTRTELVILITPRVVENDSDLESISKALSSVYERIEF